MLGMMNIGGASAERMFSLCRGAADILGWRFTVGRDFVATTKGVPYVAKSSRPPRVSRMSLYHSDQDMKLGEQWLGMVVIPTC